MRKILAVLGIIIISAQSLSAQLIQGFDTICVNTPLELTTTQTNANSYYWGFCSAYLNNAPQGSSIASGTGLDAPRSIALVVDDNNNHFIFVVNNGATNREMIRYAFGSSLANAPIAANLGDFGGLINSNPKGFWFAEDTDGWHGFLAAGNGPGASQIIRFDFANGLSALPTAIDMGNLGGLVINPQDMYIFQEAGNWHGFTNSGFTGNIIRFDFGISLSNVPAIVTIPNLGIPPLGLGFPTGFWPAFDGTEWHLFVCNAITSSVVRLDFGTSLTNTSPMSFDLGDFGGLLTSPRDISIIQDCGVWYGFVTNEGSSNIVRLEFTDSLTNPTPGPTDLGNFGGFDAPIYLTHFKRSRDNVFAFTANNGSNSISRIEFNSCLVPDIKASIFRTPPPVTYDVPGIYNVYLILDEGLPTMQIDCKQITVIDTPLIDMASDTRICLGDEIRVTANGQKLNSIQWSPSYNMFPPTGDTETVVLSPIENFTYDIRMVFANGGCVIDTNLTIDVSQVHADAGPDRVVGDGAYTTLGGPRISYGQEYSYTWTPSTFLDNPFIANPRCDPRNSEFYVLEVTNDSSGCSKTDSVYIFNECATINLPNAFNPVSDVHYNRKFGIMNNNIYKLNYFRIYNRWGNLIFETTNTAIPWDGNHNNIPAPSGTYVWMVDGECDNGKRIQKQGNVFLVR